MAEGRYRDRLFGACDLILLEAYRQNDRQRLPNECLSRSTLGLACSSTVILTLFNARDPQIRLLDAAKLFGRVVNLVRFAPIVEFQRQT